MSLEDNKIYQLDEKINTVLRFDNITRNLLSLSRYNKVEYMSVMATFNTK